MLRIPRVAGAIFVTLFCCLFILMGCWQLSRYREREHLQSVFSALSKRDPVPLKMGQKTKAPAWQKVIFSGDFTLKKSVLLEHQVYRGAVGYRLLAVFFPVKGRGLLVDRGFVSKQQWQKMSASADYLATRTLSNMVGVVYYPSKKGFTLGEMIKNPGEWPILTQQVAIQAISQATHVRFYPFIIRLLPSSKAYLGGQLPGMQLNPLKHLNYALQWFSFALILLVGYGVLIYQSRRRDKAKENSRLDSM